MRSNVLAVELHKVIRFGLRSKQHFAMVTSYAKDSIVIGFHKDYFLKVLKSDDKDY